MKTKKFLAVAAAVLGAVLMICIVYAKQKTKHPVDPAFKEYVSAYTSGTVSCEAGIRVSLTSDLIKEREVNTAVRKELFDFSPSIKGNAVWIDRHTIEFRPSEKMKSGQEYQVTFQLGSLMKVPEKLKEFEFSFQVIMQSFEVNVDGLKPQDKRIFDRQTLVGNVVTADVADVDKLEKVLVASQGSRFLPIRWTHKEGRKLHAFVVDSIVRGADSSSVLLAWNGKGMNVDLKGERSVMVPALSDFILTDATVVLEKTDQYLLLRFSDPLLETQNLQGIITLNKMSDLKFTIDDNTIRVYPSSRQTGNLDLFIDAAVKNTLGKTLKQSITQGIVFEELKPAVRLTGKGVILPGSNGLLFPFEAVSLNSVDVRVVKIFENNVEQFLQVNNMDGQTELTRVGRIVLQKTIPLSTLKQTDFSRWNQYALDLGELVKVDPGSIYRVTIGFRKKYSMYECNQSDTGKTDDDDMMKIDERDFDDPSVHENSSWDYIEDYIENGSYRWQDRENPCSNSYYTSNRWISRNVLASDLGLIAKSGTDGSMLLAITDLKTTQPLPGVTLEVYNMQHQLLQKLETNSDGLAEVNLTKKPFLLVAKKGDERGYLKLDDGSALSLSMFDVTGEKVQKGIKGFIYGERGVWRPGDSLFLTFVLQDKQKTLPEAYPVIFELFNPKGQLVKKMIRSQSMNGFYSFHTATEEEAPTGSWEAKVKVGNAIFSKTLRIETVMPNRLKIKFDFPKKYLAKNEKQSAKMEVHWLTGANAGSLKANVEVSLSASKTTFPKYSEFSFDDPTRKFSADKQVLFDKQLDASGKANVDADIKVEDAAPGVLQANFVTRVYEPGGSFSVDRFNIPYHAYDIYTGVRLPKGDKTRGMLLTDTDHIVQIVSVDRDGVAVTGKRRIEIEFYQVEWRWWWDKSEDNPGNYNNSSYHQLHRRDTITTTNGAGTWKLRLNYPNWGRYLIRATDLESGHSTGKVFYMDWPGWAGRAQNDQAGAATMLSFTADKDKYTVGEQATLTIPSGKNGRALITVESGTKIIKSYWLECKDGETRFKFSVTPDMTPNVFVSVTLLQPHAQTVNDLPIRMYGVIPLLVENPGTHLKPLIKMNDVLQPLENVKVTVSEESGKDMTYTIAVVDEGLLDLTRFQTPDPWSAFYAREALGVKTWDMFDYVMGAWGSQMERILAIGGDEGINKPKGGHKANRFKPVAIFLGPYHLNKGESQTHSFQMPQYVGSVRTMLIAGQDNAYGFTDKTTPVRKPLMVLATLPRVLGPGETVDLPVTVFAMEKRVKDVTVEIVANDLLTIDGAKSSVIKFNEPGDDVVNFRLKVKPQLGLASVKVIARCGKEIAETEIELEVRNPNPRIVEMTDTVLEPGQSWKAVCQPVGMEGTNKSTLEVSTVPPLNLGMRLDYLIHYPYGCVEQTTSSVFPQLYLSDLLELSPQQKAEIENNIRAGIDRLRLFQVSSGGMSYWPGEQEADEWASNYAGHFLVAAELKGYYTSPGFMDQWKKFQRNKAATWNNTDDASALTQAYRLYTLALAKSPELGSMNRLKENKNLPPIARWSLAAAYQLSGQPEVAMQLIAGLTTQVKDYQELSETYGSGARDKAIILETLSLMGKKDEGFVLMKQLSASLCSNDFMSTQATGYTLLAMAQFVGKSGISSTMSFTYRLSEFNGQVNTQSVIKQLEIKMKGTEAQPVTVSNTGKNLLYVRMVRQGVPSVGDLTNAKSNLDLQITYRSTDGRELDPSNIKQGTDFYAEVKVTNPGMRGKYEQMALTQIFPSGWEILNTRLDQTDNSTETSKARYQDIRDDRVNTFYDLNWKETKTFRTYLNASYLGTFYLPAVYSGAMYDAAISARLAGKWVTVSPQGGATKEVSVK